MITDVKKIIERLHLALERYQQECKISAAGKTGISRAEKFKLILDDLAQKPNQVNKTLGDLCDFFLVTAELETCRSRLMRNIKAALIDIFMIHIPQKPICTLPGRFGSSLAIFQQISDEFELVKVACVKFKNKQNEIKNFKQATFAVHALCFRDKHPEIHSIISECLFGNGQAVQTETFSDVSALDSKKTC